MLMVAPWRTPATWCHWPSLAEVATESSSKKPVPLSVASLRLPSGRSTRRKPPSPGPPAVSFRPTMVPDPPGAAVLTQASTVKSPVPNW